MASPIREVYYYRNSAGTVVVKEWLNSLKDGNILARIRLRLGRIEEGNFGDHHAVGGGVMEMRMDFGPGYRIYFGIDGIKIVVLLSGGDKKTQDTDIRTAKTYWKTYKEGGK